MRAIYHEGRESQLPEPTRENKQKKCAKRPSGFAEAMLEAPPTGPCTLNFCPVGILLGQKVLLKCNTLTKKKKQHQRKWEEKDEEFSQLDFTGPDPHAAAIVWRHGLHPVPSWCLQQFSSWLPEVCLRAFTQLGVWIWFEASYDTRARGWSGFKKCSQKGFYWGLRDC